MEEEELQIFLRLLTTKILELPKTWDLNKDYFPNFVDKIFGDFLDELDLVEILPDTLIYQITSICVSISIIINDYFQGKTEKSYRKFANLMKILSVPLEWNLMKSFKMFSYKELYRARDMK